MKIGFIGTGLLGLPMAQRLLANQVDLVVYNRTASKLEPLSQAGATVATSVSELLQQVEVVITMLTDAQAIRELLLTEEARPHLAGRTVIQMGTIAPSESRMFQQELAAIAATYFETPVLGSIPEATAGQLQVMVGGSTEQFERWQPLFQQLGTPIFIGAVGSASALKLALNQLISSLTTSFALSLGFVQQQGVDVETFMQILRRSALYAPTFDKKLPRMVERNFDDPNFPTKHMLKDTNLFVMEAIASGLQVDSAAGVAKILALACEMGLADADYSALFAAVSPEST
jgi:3-hydroxyisobutyrate dehydrogenase